MRCADRGAIVPIRASAVDFIAATSGSSTIFAGIASNWFLSEAVAENRAAVGHADEPAFHRCSVEELQWQRVSISVNIGEADEGKAVGRGVSQEAAKAAAFAPHGDQPRRNARPRTVYHVPRRVQGVRSINACLCRATGRGRGPAQQGTGPLHGRPRSRIRAAGPNGGADQAEAPPSACPVRRRYRRAMPHGFRSSLPCTRFCARMRSRRWRASR